MPISTGSGAVIGAATVPGVMMERTPFSATSSTIGTLQEPFWRLAGHQDWRTPLDVASAGDVGPRTAHSIPPLASPPRPH